MLEKMELNAHAARIKKSVLKVYQDGKHITGDVGGKATTTEFTKAVIDNL